jgi:uncharacterized protein YkwD
MASGLMLVFRSSGRFLSIFFLLIFTMLSISAEDIAEDIQESSENFNEKNSTELIRLINQIRMENGLDALEPDNAASETALLYAQELAERNVLSHTGKDGSRVLQRYMLNGGTGYMAGENLGVSDSPQLLVKGWMESPLHRKNILDPDWVKCCAGAVPLKGSRDSARVLAVLVFSNSRWTMKSCKAGKDNLVILKGYYLFDKDTDKVFIMVGSLPKPVFPAMIKEQNGKYMIDFEFQLPQSYGRILIIPFFKADETGKTEITDTQIIQIR